MKKIIAIVCAVVIACGALAGCSSQSGSSANGSAASNNAAAATSSLKAGTYTAAFDTDSSMFHINEAMDGKGTLTVSDSGEMSIHIVLVSKRITDLFVGTAEDAQKDGAKVVKGVLEEVVYSDGYKSKAYAFDIDVPALNEEYSVAILGESGKWYDHKVKVSDPQPAE